MTLGVRIREVRLGAASLLLLVALAFARSIDAAPTPAGASTIDQAREKAKQGVELYDQSQHAEALERFLEADALFPAPQNKVYAARCHVKLGRWLEGLRLYDRVVDDVLAADAPASFSEARQIATDERAVLKRRIPTLTVVLERDIGVTILLDGAVTNLADLRERPLDPGAHELVVRRVGMPDQARPIELAEGERRRIELAASAPETETAPSDEDDLAGPVGVGLLLGGGGVSLLIATITGVVAVVRVDELKARCTADGACPRSDADEAAEVEALGNASTALFVIGGVAAAAGIVWILVDSPGDSPVSLAISPGFLSFKSSF